MRHNLSNNFKKSQPGCASLVVALCWLLLTKLDSYSLHCLHKYTPAHRPETRDYFYFPLSAAASRACFLCNCAALLCHGNVHVHDNGNIVQCGWYLVQMLQTLQ